MANHHLVVLGADDPEMSAIERIVKAAGYRVAYATWGGARVSPSQAYQADEITVTPGTGIVVAVECMPQRVSQDTGVPVEVKVIDHHRPGDPGYGRPPAEYLPASSLGQVLDYLAKRGIDPLPGEARIAAPDNAHLGLIRTAVDGGQHNDPVHALNVSWVGDAVDTVRIPEDLRMIAAADHCLAAAYRGECPGVDPDHLMAWRVKTRAAFQGRTVAELEADIECACLVGTLAKARGCEVRDLKPDAARPAERFALAIKAGDTPETNQVSDIVAEWIEEWLWNIEGRRPPLNENTKEGS